jgi:GNAT superfamily N-acetyltransferase
MGISITKVEAKDRDRLLTLMSRVIATSVTQDAELKKAYINNVTQNLDWWENNSDMCCHLKAVAHQSIVGVILVKGFWNLCSLFVAPEYHRQGIGRALVMAAIDECRGKSEKQAIFLNSAPNAVSFYRAVGFIPRKSNQPQPPGVEPMKFIHEIHPMSLSTNFL